MKAAAHPLGRSAEIPLETVSGGAAAAAHGFKPFPAAALDYIGEGGEERRVYVAEFIPSKVEREMLNGRARIRVTQYTREPVPLLVQVSTGLLEDPTNGDLIGGLARIIEEGLEANQGQGREAGLRDVAQRILKALAAGDLK